MTRLRPLCSLLCLLLAGCAADGGPVGTGIAAIRGNVAAVDLAADLPAPVPAAGALPFRVTVSLDEVPGIRDTTDPEGNFTLRGAFAGTLTLRFRGPGLDVAMPVDVPAASVVVLENIRLRRQAVEPAVVRALDFVGSIALVECSGATAGELLVDDRAPGRNQFLVRLSADTVLTGPDGRRLECAVLRPGTLVRLAGEAGRRGQRTIDATEIVVDPPRPVPRADAVRPVRLVGTVVTVDCAGGLVELATLTGTTRVRLTPTTQILAAAPGGPVPAAPLRCADIIPGSRVDGSGMLSLAAPGTITAERIVTCRGGCR